jgi:hypothetical protein
MLTSQTSYYFLLKSHVWSAKLSEQVILFTFYLQFVVWIVSPCSDVAGYQRSERYAASIFLLLNFYFSLSPVLSMAF